MAISIALIIILGLSADYLFRRISLPGLVGMLLVGILIGPYLLDLMYPQMMAVSGDFRKIALIVILLRAGFELRRDTLNRVGRAALIMSSVPAVFGMCTKMAVSSCIWMPMQGDPEQLPSHCDRDRGGEFPRIVLVSDCTHIR